MKRGALPRNDIGQKLPDVEKDLPVPRKTSKTARTKPMASVAREARHLATETKHTNITFVKKAGSVAHEEGQATATAMISESARAKTMVSLARVARHIAAELPKEQKILEGIARKSDITETMTLTACAAHAAGNVVHEVSLNTPAAAVATAAVVATTATPTAEATVQGLTAAIPTGAQKENKDPPRAIIHCPFNRQIPQVSRNQAR